MVIHNELMEAICVVYPTLELERNNVRHVLFVHSDEKSFLINYFFLLKIHGVFCKALFFISMKSKRRKSSRSKLKKRGLNDVVSSAKRFSYTILKFEDFSWRTILCSNSADGMSSLLKVKYTSCNIHLPPLEFESTLSISILFEQMTKLINNFKREKKTKQDRIIFFSFDLKVIIDGGYTHV